MSDVTSDTQRQRSAEWVFKPLRYGGQCRQCARKIAVRDWGWHSGSAESHRRVVCATCWPGPGTAALHTGQALNPSPVPDATNGGVRVSERSSLAGESVRGMATRAERKAAEYRKRAESLDRYATNCRVGAEGEVALDAVLEQLVQRGWRPLPDRRSTRGGNIDELLVGPAGVAVLDAKKWSYALTIRGERLSTGRIPRNRELDHVRQLVDEARDVLVRSSMESVAVQGFMALCGDADRSRAAERVKGVWICGLDLLQLGFSSLPVVHPPRDVEMVWKVIEREFPPSVGHSGSGGPEV